MQIALIKHLLCKWRLIYRASWLDHPMWTKKTSFLHKVTLEGLRQEDLLVQVFAPNDAMVLLDLVHGQELQSANGKENQLALGDFTSSEDLVVVAHRKLWIPKQKLDKGVQKCQNKGTLCTPNVLTTLTSQVAQNASQTVHIELCTVKVSDALGDSFSTKAWSTSWGPSFFPSFQSLSSLCITS